MDGCKLWAHLGQQLLPLNQLVVKLHAWTTVVGAGKKSHAHIPLYCVFCDTGKGTYFSSLYQQRLLTGGGINQALLHHITASVQRKSNTILLTT